VIVSNLGHRVDRPSLAACCPTLQVYVYVELPFGFEHRNARFRNAIAARPSGRGRHQPFPQAHKAAFATLFVLIESIRAGEHATAAIEFFGHRCELRDAYPLGRRVVGRVLNESQRQLYVNHHS
jgi:hypothetical protein